MAQPREVEALVREETQRELQAGEEEEVAEINPTRRFQPLHSCRRSFNAICACGIARGSFAWPNLRNERRRRKRALTFFRGRVFGSGHSREVEQGLRAEQVSKVPGARLGALQRKGKKKPIPGFPHSSTCFLLRDLLRTLEGYFSHF